MTKDRSLADGFQVFATNSSRWVGSKWAFTGALVAIFLWALTGPRFHYSDTWQLVINTGTTIVTFLMVFLIQNTQNRDAKATHLKLDEIIRAIRPAAVPEIHLMPVRACAPAHQRKPDADGFEQDTNAYPPRPSSFQSDEEQGLSFPYRPHLVPCDLGSGWSFPGRPCRHLLREQLWQSYCRPERDAAGQQEIFHPDSR